MYSLRKISADNVESNFNLGDHYILIDGNRSPKEYETTYKDYFGETNERWADVYAFIKVGCHTYPLSKSDRHYIVTENGNTYENLTFK